MEQYTDRTKLKELGNEVTGMLKGAVPFVYGDDIVSSSNLMEVAEETRKAFVDHFGGKQRSPLKTLSGDEIKRLEVAFTGTTYSGDGRDEFKNYVERCWKEYCSHSRSYKAPYVAVVQSSGFGKSRMLYELGQEAKAKDSKMKVLYVCARVHESTGYPEATKELRGWLFADNSVVADIAARLKVIYYHAIANWEKVQEEWLKLFTSSEADAGVKKNLIQTNLHEDGSVDTKGRIVVLVIDEVRSLLAEGKDGKINHFRMLRKALTTANKGIRENGNHGGIFGVLVDTSSKVSDFARPWSQDPSSRNLEGTQELTSFPPFVLTNTMDTLWQDHYKNMARADEAKMDVEVANDEEKNKMAAIAAYKAAVTGDGNVGWEAILNMGRPMWKSTFIKDDRLLATSKDDVVDFAATKLLLGHSPGKDSYTEHTMFGVASMLCRLGVRPYSTSALASRAIADFMAILAYVNYEKDGYVSSYASDPVLTLGAIKVWYGREDALANFIFPQFKKLILNEALDTGGTGEVVARIVLLLAMDQCAMDADRITVRSNLPPRSPGQFVPVSAFLEKLGANEMPLRMKNFRKPNEAEKNGLDSLERAVDPLAHEVHSLYTVECGTRREHAMVFAGPSSRGYFPSWTERS